jgi:hypothetical protein
MWACDAGREKEVRRVGSRHLVQMKRQTLGQCRWDGMVKWVGLSLFACGIVFFYFFKIVKRIDISYCFIKCRITISVSAGY